MKPKPKQKAGVMGDGAVGLRGKTLQWTKELAAKSENPSSIPETHVVKINHGHTPSDLTKCCGMKVQKYIRESNIQ